MAAPCSRPRCEAAYTTTDGGKAWTRVPGRLPTVPVAGLIAVGASTAYVYGDGMAWTSDGGRTWQDLGLPSVESAAVVGDQVLALAYNHGGCPGPCRTRVVTTTVGVRDWSVLHRLAMSGAFASLSVLGDEVVVVATGARARPYAKGAVAVSRDAGTTWIDRGDPCGGVGRREYDIVDAAATQRGLALLCGPHVEKASDFVLTSTDGGRTDGSRRWLPRGDVFGHVWAGADGALVVASGGVVGGGRWQYEVIRSVDGGRHWRAVLRRTAPAYDSPENFAGLNRLHMSSPYLGSYVADPAHVWRTTDAGATWKRVLLPTS